MHFINTSVIFILFVWPGGKYCNGDGLAEPTGDCAPGWYCSGGAYTDKPTTYVNSTTLYSTNYSCPVYALNNTGGICEPGNVNQQFLSTGTSFYGNRVKYITFLLGRLIKFGKIWCDSN